MFASMAHHSMGIVTGVGIIAVMAGLFYGLLQFVVRFENDDA